MTAKNGTHTAAPQTNDAPLPEAPASASAKMISPQGIEWLLTVRDHTVNGLMGKIGVMEDHLLKTGWQPSEARRYTNSNGNGASDAAAPVCPHHGKPMKPSKHHGGYFCPGKNPDGSYCRHKVEG